MKKYRLALIFPFAASIANAQARTLDQTRSPNSVLSAAEWIATSFGVALTTHNVGAVLSRIPGNVKGTDPDSDAVLNYTVFLSQELRGYPHDALKCAGIERIILAGDLYVGIKKRAAVPAFSEHALVLDPVPPRRPAEYAARAVHHEYYHMLDRADTSRALAMDAWSRTNPDAFRYGTGGASAYDDLIDHYSIRHPANGFITEYATSELQEDRAEVFSVLTVFPSVIAEQASTDAVLSRKIELVRKHVLRVCPSFAARI